MESRPFTPGQDVLTIHVFLQLARYDLAGKVLISAPLIHVEIDNRELCSYPLYTLVDDACADEIVARERVRRMRSTETCCLALDHLSYCVKDHDACPRPRQDRVLPTRVIDCTDPEQPRLYITGGSVRWSYVALSYVWGEDQPNKTKQHNVDTYARGINVDLLPQTLRDAIWVTHACGEKYLWIDALCIIQDSKEDKRREIAKIPAIFENASFTIIAARSSKASEGFLHDCPPPSVPIHRLPFPCKDNPNRFGTIYVEQDNLDAYDDDCNLNDLVHKRAWCLEERLLSTRMLVYTSNTLRFHCRTMDMNVGDAVRESHYFPRHRLNLDWIPPPDELDPPFEHGSEKRVLMLLLWDNIVANYTARTVTQREDKLIALAGVAMRFGELWKRGPYLAGLWLDNLQNDLLWCTWTEDGSQLPRPEVYRAPSWSWASVDSPVGSRRWYEEFEILYELKAHGLALASDKLPFGAVVAGSLTLGARLLKAAWRDDGLYAYPAQLYPSGPLAEDVMNSQTDCKNAGPGIAISRAWRDAMEPCSPDVWLLPVSWETPAAYLMGLVVVSTGSPEEYRRVGCFHNYSQSISKNDVEELSLQSITLV